MNTTLTELREHWTIKDLMAAHEYLDEIERARSRAEARRRAKAKA